MTVDEETHAAPLPTSGAWAALATRLATEADWRARVIGEITDAIVREVPELGRDAELTAATRDSVDDNARIFVTMVERGLDPGAAELPALAGAFTRLLVHRGVPAEALTHTYRVAHGVFWRTWVRELRAAIPDPTELATALEQGAGYMFAFIDALSAAARRAYAEERERWVRSADAVRAQTIRELVDGLPVDAEAASRRLRYGLDREHAAVVAWSPDGAAAAPGALDPLVRELLAPLGGGTPLTTPLGHGLVAAWTAARGGIDPDALRTLAVPPAPRSGDAPAILVAVGTPARGAAGFRVAHLEAMHARRVAQLTGAAPGTVTHYADVAVPALASADPEHARRFAHAQLGPLLGDDAESARLLETLAAYLEEHASPRRAAVRLGVHENTVAARIRTAETRLGRPLAGRATELLLALRLAPVVRGDA
ncbi:helix-turn-helix domain-containing protein [Patulibacter sp. SYSU D01012]|uniref:PucR family transcriptional regulator n=1 Tax=Patulibacter sp. SYSU D01012 TaxID=2817381 RepID=UPI001B31728B|nr:helix-turn-helix domain-containing protein [Patulibacter sp. SYSU D01012]